jgi:hypothetical protein
MHWQSKALRSQSSGLFSHNGDPSNVASAVLDDQSLRRGRELLADPDTQITFRDDQVQLYRPEVKIREKIMVHNRLVESETTIRPYKYVSLPGWLLDDRERYGIKLPPPKTAEK